MGLVQVYETRDHIQAVLETIEHMEDCREKYIAKTKLEEALMWTEKASSKYAPTA